MASNSTADDMQRCMLVGHSFVPTPAIQALISPAECIFQFMVYLCTLTPFVPSIPVVLEDMTEEWRLFNTWRRTTLLKKWRNMDVLVRVNVRAGAVRTLQ